MIIRIVTAVLILAFAAFANKGLKAAETSNPPSPNPTAAPISVARVTETAVVPQTSLPARTVEATPAATVTATKPTESVPSQEKEEIKSVTPNPKAPLRLSSELNEVSGVRLTVYNCVGSTGATYCPGGSHTSSGTEVGPGTAACDPSYLGREFQIIGDKQGLTWTCLDTGNFGGNWFDLWFYDLADGLAYINNLPSPYQVTFVE